MGLTEPPPLPTPKAGMFRILPSAKTLSPKGLSWAHRGHHTKAQLEFLTGKTQNSPNFFFKYLNLPDSKGLILICNKSLTQG